MNIKTGISFVETHHNCLFLQVHSFYLQPVACAQSNTSTALLAAEIVQVCLSQGHSLMRAH
jgi:hypothetical protein